MTVSSAVPVLPAELTIENASHTRSQWLAWLGDGTVASKCTDGRQRLDGSKVSTIDGAGLQLLLALGRTLDGQGLAMQLDAPSATLCEACEALGMAHLLATEQPR